MAMIAQPFARANGRPVDVHASTSREGKGLFFHEHALGELEYLLHGVVVVAPLTRQLPICASAARSCRVVQPERVRQRTIARQRSVRKTHLSVLIHFM